MKRVLYGLLDYTSFYALDDSFNDELVGDLCITIDNGFNVTLRSMIIF